MSICRVFSFFNSDWKSYFAFYKKYESEDLVDSRLPWTAPRGPQRRTARVFVAHGRHLSWARAILGAEVLEVQTFHRSWKSDDVLLAEHYTKHSKWFCLWKRFIYNKDRSEQKINNILTESFGFRFWLRYAHPFLAK